MPREATTQRCRFDHQLSLLLGVIGRPIEAPVVDDLLGDDGPVGRVEAAQVLRHAVGSRISIEEVKAEFGVSKQPVMDAMRPLEATGIVEIVPQGVCRVVHSTLEFVDHLAHYVVVDRPARHVRTGTATVSEHPRDVAGREQRGHA